MRTLDKKEIDFLVTLENRPIMVVEVKSGDLHPANSLMTRDKWFPGAPTLGIQVVDRRGILQKLPGNTWIVSIDRFLSLLDKIHPPGRKSTGRESQGDLPARPKDKPSPYGIYAVGSSLEDWQSCPTVLMRSACFTFLYAPSSRQPCLAQDVHSPIPLLLLLIGKRPLGKGIH
jgi:hypothetical protein